MARYRNPILVSLKLRQGFLSEGIRDSTGCPSVRPPRVTPPRVVPTIGGTISTTRLKFDVTGQVSPLGPSHTSLYVRRRITAKPNAPAMNITVDAGSGTAAALAPVRMVAFGVDSYPYATSVAPATSA